MGGVQANLHAMPLWRISRCRLVLVVRAEGTCKCKAKDRCSKVRHTLIRRLSRRMPTPRLKLKHKRMHTHRLKREHKVKGLSTSSLKYD
jgi:hypothetical protein